MMAILEFHHLLNYLKNVLQLFIKVNYIFLSNFKGQFHNSIKF